MLSKVEYQEKSRINLGEGGKRKVSNFVLDSLPPKMRDKGVKSKKYKQVHAQKIHMSRSYFYIFYRRSLFSWLLR